MTSKVIGKVSETERDDIQALFERRNGLTELAKIVDANNVELYEKMVKDMGETSTKFQQWWDDMAKRYHWEGTPTGHWSINFDTCEISLEEE